MKKTAVLVFEQCCLFEITLLLNMLTMEGKKIDYVATTLEPLRSEEGLVVKADCTLDQCNLEEYDSLILTGVLDATNLVANKDILAFITAFADAGKVIGAISVAPILLVKTGHLKGKPFMAGCYREGLLEEGFTMEDLAQMVDWEEAVKGQVPGHYMKTENMITAVACGFRHWAIGVCKALGITVNPSLWMVV